MPLIVLLALRSSCANSPRLATAALRHKPKILNDKLRMQTHDNRTLSTVPGKLRTNWSTIIVIALLHMAAIAALFFFSWRSFAAAVFLYWMLTCLGISMGYHRLLTHRSYRIPRALEYFFEIGRAHV